MNSRQFLTQQQLQATSLNQNQKPLTNTKSWALTQSVEVNGNG